MVPEDSFSRVEMFMSYDAKFSLVEDHRATQVLEDGVAIRASRKDVDWCSKCYVYLLVNVEKEQRYYLTTRAHIFEPNLGPGLPAAVTVNPF